MYRLFSNPRFPALIKYELLGLFAEINQLNTPYYFEDEANAASEGLRLPMEQFWSWGGPTEQVQNEIASIEDSEAASLPN